MNFLKFCVHSAAKAPSTILWSEERVTFITEATQNYPSPSPGTTFFNALPIPRIQAWGGLTIGENPVTPNIPMFEIVKVPPMNSWGYSFPSLALAARSFISWEMSSRPLESADFTIGVKSPIGVWTATDMSTDLYSQIYSPYQLEFVAGTLIAAKEAALMTMSFTDILDLECLFNFSLSCKSLSTSQSMLT